MHPADTDDRRTWALDVGDTHPASHGPVAFDLRVVASGDREVITFAEPRIQPIHRGVEKLFESRDYRQALMLADRHDWHSALGSELGLALTLESMLGIAVPERATWLRTLLSELSRAIHHLRWLGETAAVVGSDLSVAATAHAAREGLIDLLENATGGRLHPMAVAPGGLRSDVNDPWLELLTTTTAAVRSVGSELAQWADRATSLVGVGVLPLTDAVGFGTSGPVARASGLALDLRFEDPYCAYSELIETGDLTRVVRDAGDAQARMQTLAEELAVSLDCIDTCASHLIDSPGPISVRLPRSLRVPEGTAYDWTENPTGINGWLVVSRGGPEPYRMKLRTASFNNAGALSQLLVGTDVEDLPITVMSFLLVAGDLGK
ncbi:MAG: NADH-quinone oxidoreductase subunit D [Candidatus Nanopelagicales bacterium]